MKKILALMLMLVLVLFAVACGETVPPPSTQQGTEGQTDGANFPLSTQTDGENSQTDGTDSAESNDADSSDADGTDTGSAPTDESTEALLPGEVALSLVATVNRVGEDGLLLEQAGRWYFVPCAQPSSFCVGDRVIVSYASSPETVHYGVPYPDGSGTERLCVTFDKVLSCDPAVSGSIAVAKPVIYLYPQEETEIFVRVDFQGEFTATIPHHGEGWRVTATPDGTLTVDGRTYPYLFWEGIASPEGMTTDVGYSVAGTEVEAFFSDVLIRMGLTEGEAKDFMEYWVPRMEGNPYNIISFQTDAYEAIAPLTVSPTPDSVLRIFMTYRVSDAPADLPAPEILPFVRKGFTLVEWGGGQLTN